MINEAVVRGVYAILSGQITRVGATGLITLYIIVFIIEIGKQIDYKLCYLSVWLQGIRGELKEKKRGGDLLRVGGNGKRMRVVCVLTQQLGDCALLRQHVLCNVIASQAAKAGELQ